MKKTAFVLAAFMTLAPLAPVQAQSQTAVTAVDELMEMVKVEYLFDTMLDQMMGNLRPVLLTTLKAQFQQAGMNIPDSKIEEIVTVYAEEFSSYQPEFINLVRQIYLEEYSEQEITYLLQLYKTDPVMKKFIDRTPEIALRSSKAGEAIGQKFGQIAMQKAVQKVLAGQ